MTPEFFFEACCATRRRCRGGASNLAGSTATGTFSTLGPPAAAPSWLPRLGNHDLLMSCELWLEKIRSNFELERTFSNQIRANH